MDDLHGKLRELHDRTGIALGAMNRGEDVTKDVVFALLAIETLLEQVVKRVDGLEQKISEVY